MHIQPGKYGERGNRLGQFLGYVTVNNSEDFFEQDGIWELHLCTFRQMLPYFHWYDHTNYARWGCVYLATCKGNVVVKGSDQPFNQVGPDHSHEWLNSTGKKGGGIVRITKTTSTLSR